MDLQDIDVGAQSLYTLLYCVEDVLTAQANLVDHFTVVLTNLSNTQARIFFVDTKVAFGEDDDLVSWDVVLLQRLSDDSLGDAVGVDVGLLVNNQYWILTCVGWLDAYRIPSVDAALVRMFKKRQAFGLIQDPGLPLGRAVAHGAQNDPGHLEARPSQATLC